MLGLRIASSLAVVPPPTDQPFLSSCLLLLQNINLLRYIKKIPFPQVKTLSYSLFIYGPRPKFTFSVSNLPTTCKTPVLLTVPFYPNYPSIIFYSISTSLLHIVSTKSRILHRFFLSSKSQAPDDRFLFTFLSLLSKKLLLLKYVIHFFMRRNDV